MISPNLFVYTIIAILIFVTVFGIYRIIELYKFQTHKDESKTVEASDVFKTMSNDPDSPMGLMFKNTS